MTNEKLTEYITRQEFNDHLAACSLLRSALSDNDTVNVETPGGFKYGGRGVYAVVLAALFILGLWLYLRG